MYFYDDYQIKPSIPLLATSSSSFNPNPFKQTDFSMSLCLVMLRWITPRSPLLIYAAAWTALLTATVAIASFAPELAFVSAISPSSSFSQMCGDDAAVVRVPSDLTGAVICLPVELFTRSKIDLIVPPLFAAVVVAGSAFVVRAMGLWEEDA